jgi:hypothetical protein
MSQPHDTRQCGGANYCPTCKAAVRAEWPRVPVIPQRDVGPAPKSIPWHLADRSEPIEAIRRELLALRERILALEDEA